MRTDWIAFWADITPERTAIKIAESGKSYDYKGIHGIALKWATGLRDHYGIKKGSRVAILAKTCIEYIYLFSAAQKLGFVLVPLNYRLTASEVETLIEDIDPALLLFKEEFKELVPQVNRCITLSEMTIEFSTCSPLRDLEPIDLDDPLFILYTSGSSGIPKGSIYTHKMLFWNSVNTQISLKIDTDTTTVLCMPPFHTGGWNVLLTPILHAGGCCVLMEKFEAKDVIREIEKNRCSIFMGVPTMLSMMKNESDFENADLSSLDYILVGGEAMSLDLIESYQEKGIPIRQGYGMTEVGPNLTSLHHNDSIRKRGSIGKPNMYVETKVVDDEGNEVGPGESGELLLSGPVVTPGYFNNKEETQKSFSGHWFHTGDVVIKDDEGFLYIVDRIKNMYISGGENVYPLQVEKILSQHPSIREIAIIGVPDEKWGETGLAFLSIAEQDSLSLDKVKSFCKGKLSKYKIPKHLKLLNELPKSDTGKIDRKLLKQWAKEKFI